jgi:3-oxoadipate enol-lactonase
VPERIALERWGDAGPSLLCLHGLGGGAAFFSALGPALAADCRTVAFDFPGSGATAADVVTFEALAAVVVDVARQLPSPVHIVGHSMGTIIGLEAIRQSPGLAAGFVAAGGLLQPRADACERIAARLALIERDGMKGLGPSVAAANVSARTRDGRPDILALVADLFERQTRDGYTSTARALIEWRERPLPPLDGVRCLAVTGAEDRYAPPDDVRAMASRLPQPAPVIVLPDCGHLAFLEDPLAFSETVRGFLATA